MRERQFVDQNKEKWERFEAFADGRAQPGPDELSDLYTGITDDLSYARTYYGRRSIRVYLNNLSRKVYLDLYKRRCEKGRPLLYFFTQDLPHALYRARRELNISLIFFVLSMAIGVFSSIHDPDFAAVILGDDYVSMTENNIRRGEPMGVYKQSAEIDMFLAITLNNLLVAFRTFVLGAFFGIGTLIIMLYNGIMVGTFQYFFIERALFGESFLTIWMHGALEISALVISGAAGLTMGRGLLYPGTLPRMQSFQIGARRAFKIMLGLVPVFVAAGFIEGFFTRLTELHDVVRGAFIFGCFAFVGLYFWWYPRLLFRGTDADTIRKDELITSLQTVIDLPVIRKSKEVFTATFSLFRLNFWRIVGVALLTAVVYTGAFWFIYGEDGVNDIDFTRIAAYNMYQFHSYDTFFWNFFLNVFLISTVSWTALRFFKGKFKEQLPTGFHTGFRLFIKIAVIVTLFELCILSGNVI
ncbi:MAG: stage II sporulation protein M, partial [Cryomorphaceae bacterium]